MFFQIIIIKNEQVKETKLAIIAFCEIYHLKENNKISNNKC
jgi:hypothetical protein